MSELSLLVELALAITASAPPSVLGDRSVLQRVADAGTIVEGRDPFAGTGLCGALLPF